MEKEDGLAEMLTDYNNLYAMQFDMSTYSFSKRMWLQDWHTNNHMNG